MVEQAPGPHWSFAMSGTVDPLAAGILIGIAVVLFALRAFAPHVMIRRDEVTLSQDRAVEAILEAAAARGWSVPTVHHLHESSREVGREIPAATVIELCRPDYAAGLLASDDARAVSAMLPCRLAVYETTGGAVVIARMNVAFMGRLFGGPAQKVMTRASVASEEIVASLRGSWGG
jgi:uncharacterized protein (DUF302 family)